MPNSWVPTILATAEHLIRCHVDTRGQRLLEVLNNQQSRYLEIYDVEVFRRAETVAFYKHDQGVINKVNIAFAIPAAKKHEAPQKRVDSFSVKKSYDAFAVVAGYEIRGHLQTRATEDTVTLLTHHDGEFVAFPAAAISYVGCDDEQPEMQVALVNTSRITYIDLTAAKPSAEDLSAVIREIVANDELLQEAAARNV